MKNFLLLALVVIFGVMTWRVGSSLSSDALGMAVGVVFGVLAGIPAALLVLATNTRRREQEEDERYDEYGNYRTARVVSRQAPQYAVTEQTINHDSGLVETRRAPVLLPLGDNFVGPNSTALVPPSSFGDPF